MQQFKRTNVTFFECNAAGQLRQISWNATDEEIMAIDSATLKLDDKNNGLKGVCIDEKDNGNTNDCPVWAL